jgi:hypothetical protein
MSEGGVLGPAGQPDDIVVTEARRWILWFAIAFLISLALGWLLPNGLNALARLLDQPEVPLTPLVRFFCLAMTFFASASIELLIWMRQRSAETLSALNRAVESGLEAGVSDAVSNVVLRAILPSTSTTPEGVEDNARLLSAYTNLLATVPPRLLGGYSVLIESGVAKVDHDLRAVASTGLEVNIQRHVEITRRFTARAHSFLQINRKAFDVPEQWTQEWLDLVEELGSRDLKSEYIVLMTSDKLDESKSQLNRMGLYLEARDWTFRCCSLEKVRDALGGVIPTEANLDIYDGEVAKLQAPPQGEYVGGIKLNLRLLELQRNPEFSYFIDVVRQYARPPAT